MKTLFSPMCSSVPSCSSWPMWSPTSPTPGRIHGFDCDDRRDRSNVNVNHPVERDGGGATDRLMAHRLAPVAAQSPGDGLPRHSWRVHPTLDGCRGCVLELQAPRGDAVLQDLAL